MRIIFMGTPDFAVPSLKALDEAFDVVEVVTRPDAVRSRGKKLEPSAVKAEAAQLGLPVLEADLALHFGPVVYGNVGSGRRLDFTVIGRAVNEVSRIEALCGALVQPLLVSDALAARSGQALQPVGSFALRGISGERRIWRPA